MLKTISHPSSPKTFKMGRVRPRARRYGLQLRNYVNPLKIDLPERTNYASKAMPCLDQIMLNDVLGDCTAAAAFHIEGLLQANAGRPQQKFANVQIKEFYSETTGYDPSKTDAHGNNPTDQGGDEGTVLNYWRDHGLYKNGHKIVGHASVDGTNWDLARSAVYLFENLYFGIVASRRVGVADALRPRLDVGRRRRAGRPERPRGRRRGLRAGQDRDRLLGHARLRHAGGRRQVHDVRQRRRAAHGLFSYDAIDKASKKAPNGFAADELLFSPEADFKKFSPEAIA